MRRASKNKFDVLGAKYDIPMSPEEIGTMVDHAANGAVEVFYGSNRVVATVCRVDRPIDAA